MRIRYLLSFLFVLICFKTEALEYMDVNSPTIDTLINVPSKQNTICDTINIRIVCTCDNPHTDNDNYTPCDGIDILTLLINSFNNWLTWANLFIALIAVLITIVGIIGFRNFTEIKSGYEEEKGQIKEFKEQINKTANELEKRNGVIERTQILSNQYLQRVNEWMYSNAYAIAETTATSGNPKQGQNLMHKSWLNYNLMKLFLTKDKHEIDSYINYIKSQGGKEEIDHLQFIVNNEPDEYKRNKASEAIGYIKGRITS